MTIWSNEFKALFQDLCWNRLWSPENAFVIGETPGSNAMFDSNTGTRGQRDADFDSKKVKICDSNITELPFDDVIQY